MDLNEKRWSKKSQLQMEDNKRGGVNLSGKILKERGYYKWVIDFRSSW